MNSFKFFSAIYELMKYYLEVRISCFANIMKQESESHLKHVGSRFVILQSLGKVGGKEGKMRGYRVSKRLAINTSHFKLWPNGISKKNNFALVKLKL